jgi:chromosome segregation protein
MTGDEILDAGVQVMAQPPGKKNATIHLLSGGEKALTATALVFAMFQLNPAPFCLLDEVDAPLDDANTERFANLVRAMSDKTQFLFISQQDRDGDGAAADRRDDAGAGRVAHRRGGHGNRRGFCPELTFDETGPRSRGAWAPVRGSDEELLMERAWTS